MTPATAPLTIHKQKNMANWKFGRRQNIQNQHLYYITIKKQAQVRPNSNTPLRKQGRASREPQNFGKQTAPTP